VILTSEAFQNLNDFQSLRILCRGFYVVVVCYLREYLDYVTSAYVQEVKKNGVFSGFLEFQRSFTPNIDRFISRWEEFANECNWRLYQRDRLANGDVVCDFLATAGLPDLGENPYQDENRRFGGSLLGFKLLANGAGLHSLQLMRKLDLVAASNERFQLPLRITPEQQKRLRNKSSYNAVLVERFGDLRLKDFSNGVGPFESSTLDDDFRYIIAEVNEFPRVQNHPLFARFIDRKR